MVIQLLVNGETRQVDVDADTPLLWVLRDELGLMGTKFGCGVSACGACTVHVNGIPRRSCRLKVESADGQEITTIEGLSPNGPHPLQTAWIEHQVPQCGYCQSGMIMAASALLANNPSPSDEDIDREITNICRCGTYGRIRQAIHTAAATTQTGDDSKAEA